MAYIKVNWLDGQSPALNADNLNHMDDQIYQNTADIASLNTGKQDKVTGAGNIALLGSSGLEDSGKDFDDLAEWGDADISTDGEFSNDDSHFPTSKLVKEKLSGKADKPSNVSNGRIAMFNGNNLADSGKSFDSYNASATDYGLSNDDKKVPSSKIVKALLDKKADASDLSAVETALDDKLETAPDGDNFLLNAQMKVSSLYLDDAVKGSFIYGGVITAFDSDTKVADIVASDAAKARLGSNLEYIHYQLTDAALVGFFFKTNVNFVLSYNQYNTSDLIVCFGGSCAALMLKTAGMASSYVSYVGNTSAPPTGYVLAEYKLGTMYMYNNSGVYTPYICVESSYNGGLGYKHKWLNLKTGEVISE